MSSSQQVVKLGNQALVKITIMKYFTKMNNAVFIKHEGYVPSRDVLRRNFIAVAEQTYTDSQYQNYRTLLLANNNYEYTNKKN
jgi:hypothetical protein